eukprot:SAG11_NODE_11133_length_782_cov_0.909224_2_plen_92_part_01
MDCSQPTDGTGALVVRRRDPYAAPPTTADIDDSLPSFFGVYLQPPVRPPDSPARAQRSARVATVSSAGFSSSGGARVLRGSAPSQPTQLSTG